MFNNQSKFNPEDDKYLAVKFSKKAIHNEFKSKEENKQIFENVDWINIRIPGDKTSEVSRKVRDEDKKRFEFQWTNFTNREENKLNGVPVDLLPGITPAQVATLNSMQVQTVEQLSKLQEKAIKKLASGRDLVKRAEKFLLGDHYAKELEIKNEALEKSVKDLGQSIIELQEQMKLLKGNKDEPVDNNTKCDK